MDPETKFVMMRSTVQDNYDEKTMFAVGVYDTLETALNDLQHRFYLALDINARIGIKPNWVFFLDDRGWPIIFKGCKSWGMRAEFDPPAYINSLSFWIEPVPYVK